MICGECRYPLGDCRRAPSLFLNRYYGGAATSDLAGMDLMITELEPLLVKHVVNVGCYGHNHVVQRPSAVKNRTA